MHTDNDTVVNVLDSTGKRSLDGTTLTPAEILTYDDGYFSVGWGDALDAPSMEEAIVLGTKAGIQAVRDRRAYLARIPCGTRNRLASVSSVTNMGQHLADIEFATALDEPTTARLLLGDVEAIHVADTYYDGSVVKNHEIWVMVDTNTRKAKFWGAVHVPGIQETNRPPDWEYEDRS